VIKSQGHACVRPEPGEPNASTFAPRENTGRTANSSVSVRTVEFAVLRMELVPAARDGSVLLARQPDYWHS